MMRAFHIPRVASRKLALAHQQQAKIVCSARSSSCRSFSSYTPPPFELKTYTHPSMDHTEFVKTIRKPHGLYSLTMDAVKDDLRGMSELKGDAGVRGVLNEKECEQYLNTLLTNYLFPRAVHNYFDKSCFGLPLFGASIYSHMTAGLGNYIMEKKGVDSIDKALRYITYYRSPVMYDELERLGYNEDQILEIVAKQFYMQYWSGKPFGNEKDPLIFNPMVRSFYPCDSHLSSGSTDLGRDTELQAARLFCMGNEGMDPPVTIINAGDTLFFTDGAMHALNHIVEAKEKGYKMPLIFQINANNSAISARFDYGQKFGDNGDFGVQRIQQRFESYKDMIDPGFVTWAEDVSGGIESMRKAVDQVLDTGRPTYVVSRFPFRPGGHASDQSPAPEEMLLDQFVKFKDIVVHTLSSAAPTGTTGDDLIQMIEKHQKKIEDKVEIAITGTQILTREEIRELSQPGSETVLAEERGEMVNVDVNYLLGKKQRSFAGMGSDIYGKSINRQMDIGDKEGIAVRYVHQENHHKGQHDTRGGVYGELNPIEVKHMDKFVGFMPQESQVIQVGAAFRSVLAGKNRVFVKGPHTIFNEHAKDHIRYAAYRYCDNGQHANHIYVFDGGSLANQEKDQFVDKDTGDIITRDLFLARVGEHHNSPEYSAYAADSNTVMALPIDMNVFSNSMDEMVRLHDLGRMVIGVAPTASFGLLHPTLELPEHKKDNLNINDTLQIKIPGKNRPLNNRKLIVISWGPDCKMIAKVLAKEQLDCELLVVNFNRVPNSLVTYFDSLATDGKEVEVICVDPNPNSALLGPVMSQLRRRLGWPEHLIFSECTISTAYVPYGLGDPLLQPNDVRRALRNRKIIADQKEGFTRLKLQRTKSTGGTITEIEVPDTTASSGSSGSSGSAQASSATGTGKFTTINAPMDGEGVYITFLKQPGDVVSADELICEIESDKANIDVTAPCNGIVKEYHVEEKKAMDVNAETRIVTIEEANLSGGIGRTESGAVGRTASGAGNLVPSGKIEIVNAPMDGEGVYVSFMKSVGDQVEADELIAEIESDKATIEVLAPCQGEITEFFVEAKKAVDLTNESKILAIQPLVSSSSGSSSNTGNVVRAQSGTTSAPSKPVGFSPTIIKDDENVEFEKRQSEASVVQPLNRFQNAMARNMSVNVGDTYCFNLMEKLNFDQIRKTAKDGGCNPVALLVKALGEAARVKEMNKKLSRDRESMITFRHSVDIGVAVDVAGQLRTPVVRNVCNKSAQEIQNEIVGFVKQGAKLSAEDQDLKNVCYTVSTMGKDATDIVIPVLPKNTSGIIGVGRRGEDGSSWFVGTFCHATMTGVEGTHLMQEFAGRLNTK